MEIAIIGGGISGLATAIALQKVGYETRVYEAASEIKALGAGLSLAANAMMALERIGLSEQVMAIGKMLPAFAILDQRGRYISNTDSEKIKKYHDTGNFVIHRAALHRVLLSQLSKGQLFTGKQCISVRQETGKVHVEFKDGSRTTADALVVADGIHSALRQQLLPSSRPRYAGYSCWRAVIDSSRLDIDKGTETWGSKGRFGLVPMANNQLYWFACLNGSAQNKRFKAFRVEDLQTRFADYHQAIVSTLSATKDEDLIWNDIIDIRPIRRFAFDRIVLVGDAAHATTPNMGQGACQALEDAAVLMQTMVQSENEKPETAFKAFEQRRIRRTAWIVNNSYRFGKIAQWESPLLISLRNALLRGAPQQIMEKQLEILYKVDF